jgi:hypothetical protein
MMPPEKLPSAVGARMLGDDYQHILTWMYAVRLLIASSGVTRVRMEADEAGNVDDLVVETSHAPTLYHQVKFTRGVGEPIDHTWFTSSGRARRSPLQRFSESFDLLIKSHTRPQMALVTNRVPVSDDLVLKHIEGANDLLVPRWWTVEPRSESAKIRAAWATHLGISDEALRELLSHLAIRLGQGSVRDVMERCADVMLAAALQNDKNAITLGYTAIRSKIEAGMRELDPGSMRELVEELGLAAVEPHATLVVQGIKPTPFAEAATVTLDWQELYEDDRRSLRDPSSAERMLEDLRSARTVIEAAGYGKVDVRGHFRLGTAFAIGAELSRTAKFELAVRQNGATWTTAGHRSDIGLSIEAHEVGLGEDVAICLSISRPIVDDVLKYLEAQHLPIGRLLDIRPHDGPERDALADPADARAVVDATVLEAGRTPEKVVHLFLCAPNAVALMMGHGWNRVPATQVYEDTNPGYQPTFRFERR